uniref:Ig-like domain-containing protein n=1 Tax=Pygocentrus nattereri TaxID=42514 RepID=A0A3B4CPP6_PYGNA
MKEKMCKIFVMLLSELVAMSLQEIEAVVGHNIILPCSNSDEALRNKWNVFWRFRDSRTVYDIIDSRASFDEQDASFRSRVESFPAEWTQGNFSIALSNVEKADGGPYTCFIPAINKQTKVELVVQGLYTVFLNALLIFEKSTDSRSRCVVSLCIPNFVNSHTLILYICPTSVMPSLLSEVIWSVDPADSL